MVERASILQGSVVSGDGKLKLGLVEPHGEKKARKIEVKGKEGARTVPGLLPCRFEARDP